MAAADLRQAISDVAWIVSALKEIQRLLDHAQSIVDAKSLNVQAAEVRQSARFTHATFVGLRKLNGAAEILFGFLEIALARESISELEQCAGREIFKLLLLRKRDGLLRVILSFRNQTLFRRQVTQLDQRRDLLS